MAAPVVRIQVTEGFAWWQPLVRWLLALPHLLWTGLLGALAGVAALIVAITVLVTGRVPQGPARLVTWSLRQRVRTFAYFFLLRQDFPPFATGAAATDPGDDAQVEVSIEIPAELPRWAALRFVLVLHHVLVLAIIGGLLDSLYLVFAIVAAVGRRLPEGLGRFLVQVEQWVVAVAAYALLATEDKPTFGLSAYPGPA